MQLTYAQKFVGGMMGLLLLSIGVNIYMITMALKTNDGLVTQHYYRVGLHYNSDHPHYNDRMGWKVALQMPDVIQQAKTCSVTLTDQKDQPLAQASVTVELYRPNMDGYDQNVKLKEVAPGRYEAPVTVPLMGLWDATVHIQQGHDVYDYFKKLRIAEK